MVCFGIFGALWGILGIFESILATILGHLGHFELFWCLLGAAELFGAIREISRKKNPLGAGLSAAPLPIGCSGRGGGAEAARAQRPGAWPAVGPEPLAGNGARGTPGTPRGGGGRGAMGQGWEGLWGRVMGLGGL